MNTLSYLLQLIAGVFTTNANYEITGQQTRETLSTLTESLYLRAGSIIVWPGPVSAIPEGWHLCDGSSYSLTGYADLFNALGAYLSPYGVNVSAGTFQIPNIEASRTIIQGGTTKYGIGGKGGYEDVTLNVTHLPPHGHITQVWWAKVGDNDNNYIPVPTGKAGNNAYRRPELDENTGNTGGGQAHPNMPPYIAMNWIIKLY
jgi:microcystin-dependent protein